MHHLVFSDENKIVNEIHKKEDSRPRNEDNESCTNQPCYCI
uniref:Uncharacterized protein n=1 Tax=Anguilla anguilla TaxID=7936 RepID=A0A0E9WI20_ANGAN